LGRLTGAARPFLYLLLPLVLQVSLLQLLQDPL